MTLSVRKPISEVKLLSTGRQPKIVKTIVVTIAESVLTMPVLDVPLLDAMLAQVLPQHSRPVLRQQRHCCVQFPHQQRLWPVVRRLDFRLTPLRQVVGLRLVVWRR